MMAMLTMKTRRSTEAVQLPDLETLTAAVEGAEVALRGAVAKVRAIEEAAGSSISIERDRSMLQLDPARRRVVELRVAADDARRALEAAAAQHRAVRLVDYETQARTLAAQLAERLEMARPVADALEDLRDQAAGAGVQLPALSYPPVMSEAPGRPASMLDHWTRSLRRDGWLES